MNSDTTPTVVLGFDALDFTYLDAFDLPTFESVRANGVEASLESTFPPWTGSAWPSMYTGCDPSTHGVYSFFDFSEYYPDAAPTVTRNDVRRPALWNYLSARDRTVVVLNVPVTHPAEPVAGALVPGYLAPETASGFPEGIRDDLSEQLDEKYRIYSRAEMVADKSSKLAGYLDLIDMHGQAAVALVEAYDPDVTIVQIQKTDAVFHNFDDEQAFEQVYRAADRVLDRVVDVIDPRPNVVVCSDHGMGPTTGYKIHINEILRSAGFVKTIDDGAAPSLREAKSDWTAGTDRSTDSLTNSLIGRAATTAHSLLTLANVRPGDVQQILRRVGLEKTVIRTLPDTIRTNLSEDIDWRRSQAYARTGSELGVRINLAGRDPNGVVPPDEYNTVRDEIVTLLSNLETPSGDPAFEFVKPREKLYEGPYSDLACDVLFKPAAMNHTIATNLVGREFVSTECHNHKSQGVFLTTGPSIQTNTELSTLSLTDVAPLVMALQGCPVPERMTGSAPSVLFDEPPARSSYNVSFGTGEAVITDDDVEARLEDLGYL